MTHHFVITSSLLIKILKIDKFVDFSCDIDYNSRTDVFRDVITLIINQWSPQVPKGRLLRTQSVRQQHNQAKRACIIQVTRKIYGIDQGRSHAGGIRSICSEFDFAALDFIRPPKPNHNNPWIFLWPRLAPGMKIPVTTPCFLNCQIYLI